MERLAADPTASVPKACNGWGETMAAYRFFDNAGVDWRAIVEPHWQQTQQRMGEQKNVLCLQDTTELDFNGQQARCFGPLTFEGRRGMYSGRILAQVSRSAKSNLRCLPGRVSCWRARCASNCGRVGGFLARKGDGEPGVKTIWFGLKDVHVAEKTMKLLRRRSQPGPCVTRWAKAAPLIMNGKIGACGCKGK